MGTPCSALVPSAATTRVNSSRASSTSPALRKVRPQHSGRAEPSSTTVYPPASRTDRAARAFSGSKYREKQSTKSATSLPACLVGGAR